MDQTAYEVFFKSLTGFLPSPFQLQVADALLSEKSVILRAPTGSGKTWAVVAPFLYSLVTKNPIADRLLYALPLRSLATSLWQSTRDDVMQCKVTAPFIEKIRIQTGEQKADPLFEGLVTFSTIDQLLSSYLLHPVGLPKRLGNINAGAILGALICFDEFHLLEPAKSMATAIEMLNTVSVSSPLSRFVLMTATLSSKSLAWLSANLNAELIDLSEDEVQGLPSQQGKTRNYKWIPSPLSPAHIASVHGGGRTIVIANSVGRAQEIYGELQTDAYREILGDKTQIRLLHSRFFPGDRREIEIALKDFFGRDASTQDVVLVATQVLEAGLDYSSDNLHTEVAPLSAVIQRGGRCARRKGELGTVWIYPLPKNSSGTTAYGAYKEVATLVDATEQVLSEELGASARPLQFHDELRLVDRVHTQWELNQLRPLESIHDHRAEVRKAMDHEEPSAVRNLIRDVDSINVVITDNPESLKFDQTRWPELLSIPPSSLYQLFKSDQPDTADWIAQAASEEEVFEGGRLEIRWKTLANSHDLATAGWLVAIHPSRATYRKDMGLLLGTGGPAELVQYRDRPKYERYSYLRETYSEHIRRVRAAGIRRDRDNSVASRRIARWLKNDESDLAAWLELVYLLHDVGKLSEAWQEATWAWQSTKEGATQEIRPCLAHSDYDPVKDRGKRQPLRPPHASEGAYAVAEILYELLQSYGRVPWLAAMTAITRHHGRFTSSLSEFRLVCEASILVNQTLDKWATKAVLRNSPKPSERLRFSDNLVSGTNPDDAEALLLYLYLVRRLRIADQNSFKEQ